MFRMNFWCVELQSCCEKGEKVVADRIQLTGSIPSELGLSPSLTNLDLGEFVGNYETVRNCFAGWFHSMNFRYGTLWFAFSSVSQSCPFVSIENTGDRWQPTSWFVLFLPKLDCWRVSIVLIYVSLFETTGAHSYSVALCFGCPFFHLDWCKARTGFQVPFHRSWSRWRKVVFELLRIWTGGVRIVFGYSRKCDWWSIEMVDLWYIHVLLSIHGTCLYCFY